MRLIDADDFEKELSSVWKWLVDRDKKGYGTTHGEMLDKVHDILIKQQTAYEVDRIVAELGTAREDYVDDENYDVAYGLELAIEIVKGGVVNEID